MIALSAVRVKALEPKDWSWPAMPTFTVPPARVTWSPAAPRPEVLVMVRFLPESTVIPPDRVLVPLRVVSPPISSVPEPLSTLLYVPPTTFRLEPVSILSA